MNINTRNLNVNIRNTIPAESVSQMNCRVPEQIEDFSIKQKLVREIMENFPTLHSSQPRLYIDP